MRLRFWKFGLLVLVMACGGDDSPSTVVRDVSPGYDELQRMASEETYKFASWLVAQEGDGVVMLVPMRPVKRQHCANVNRMSFGERWDAELDEETMGDPLKEGGMSPMSQARKEEIILEDPMARLAPQLAILPPETELPFANLPEDQNLYSRTEFGNHASWDFWDHARRSTLPMTDEMLRIFDQDWEDLRRQACIGASIPKRAYSERSETDRQLAIGASRRMGLRYIVVDTELFGEEGMEIMARQLNPHLVGRQDFKDGSGVTIFELISADVAGRSLREGAAADYRGEQ